MVSQETIANSLMKVELPSEDIAGLVLEMSKITTPVAMPTPPCQASVERVLKKGWTKVATAVMSGSKAFLGNRLVKNNSVQVKRALAQFSDDQETLKTLHEWAMTKDQEIVETTVSRIEAEWLLERLESGISYPGKVISRLSHRLADERQDLLDRAFSLPSPVRDIFMIAAVSSVASSEVPNWNIQRLLEASETSRSSVVRSLLYSYQGVVSTELVSTLIGYQEVVSLLKTVSFSRAISYEPNAARALLEISPNHGYAILSTSWDRSLFEDFLRNGSPEIYVAMISIGEEIKKFSKDEISRIIQNRSTRESVEDSYRPALFNKSLLQVIDYELESEVLLAYLRHTEELTTWQWLTGSYTQKPTVEEIEKLVSDPGFAFGYQLNYARSSNEPRYVPTSKEEISSDMTRHLANLLDKPWVDALVDALGPSAFSELINSYENYGPKYVAERFVREIGTDVGIWRDAFAQFERSQLSMGKTLAAVRKLRGMSKKD
jgi:hypothetical protein